MDGPWTKYGPPPTEPAAGPWQKYAPAAAPSGGILSDAGSAISDMGPLGNVLGTLMQGQNPIAPEVMHAAVNDVGIAKNLGVQLGHSALAGTLPADLTEAAPQVGKQLLGGIASLAGNPIAALAGAISGKGAANTENALDAQINHALQPTPASPIAQAAGNLVGGVPASVGTAAGDYLYNRTGSPLAGAIGTALGQGATMAPFGELLRGEAPDAAPAAPAPAPEPVAAPEAAPAPAPAPAPAAVPAPALAPVSADPLARIVQAAQELQGKMAPPVEGKAVALTPGGNRVSTVTPATPEDYAQLDALKSAKAGGTKLTPKQTALYADLLEKSQNSATVAGRPIPGVLSMNALDHMRATLGKAPTPTGMFDIDNFKQVNDQLGHPMGDEVIRSVGAKLAEKFGAGNVVHRGGDEFLTLGDPDGAKMKEFQGEMESSPITFKDAEGNVATFPGIKLSTAVGEGVNDVEQSLRADKTSRAAAGVRHERAATDRRAAAPVNANADAGGAAPAPEVEPAGNTPSADVTGNGADHVGEGIPPDIGAVRQPDAGAVAEPTAEPAPAPPQPDQSDLAFSKARPGEPAAGTNVPTARGILSKASKGATTRMERMGSLKIHPTGETMPGGDAQARAVFDGRTLHVAANRVTPESSMPLLLHEAMHTDLRAVLGPKYDDFMAQAQKLAQTDPIARQAVAGIPADTPAARLPEEQAAHIAEFVAKQKPKGMTGELAAFVRRFYHAVRSHIYTSKLGALAQKAGMNLGPEDIAAFSRRAASKMYERGGRVTESDAVPNATQAARPVGAHIPIGPVDKLYDKMMGPLADKIGAGVSNLFKRVYMESRLSPADKADLLKARTVRAGARFDAEDIAHDSASFTPEDRKAVGDYIEAEKANSQNPPQHVLVEAQKMQNALKEQRERLIALIGEDSRPYLEEHGIHYLARDYEKNMPKEIERQFKNGLSGKVKADFLRARGVFKTIPKDQLDAFKAKGWRDDTALVQTLNGKKLGNKMTVWRDFTPAERAKMGENTDGHYRFVKSWTQTEQFIAMHELYGKLAARYDHLGPTDGVLVPEDTLPGTKVPKYGKLAGKFVPQEVADEVLGGFKPSTKANQTITKMTNLWKYGKVSNSRTVIADMIGKAIFSHLGGHSLLNPANLGLYKRALDSVMTKDANFRLAVEHGAAQNDIISHADESDLRNVMQPVGDSVPAVHDDLLNRMLTLGKKVAGAPLRPWSGFLHGGTNVFKMAGFLNSLDHGATVEQAAAHANLYHFDFNDIPPGMRQLQKYSAFANWTRLAIKAAGHSFLHSPHRYATVVGMFYAYNQLAALADPALEKAERKTLPKHIQGSNPMFMTTQASLLPMKADNGDNIWVDTSSMIPGRDLSGTNDVEGGAPIPSWAMPSNPMLTVPLSIITGIDPYSGQHLTQETDTGTEKTEKIAGNVARSLEPTEYGMIGQTAQNLTRGHDYAMKPYGAGDALTTQIARVHKVGPEDIPPKIHEDYEHTKSLINKSRWQIRDALQKQGDEQKALDAMLKKGEISQWQYQRDLQSAQQRFNDTRTTAMQHITGFEAKLGKITKEAAGG